MTPYAFALGHNIHISTTGSFNSEIVLFGIGHTVRVRHSALHGIIGARRACQFQVAKKTQSLDDSFNNSHHVSIVARGSF